MTPRQRLADLFRNDMFKDVLRLMTGTFGGRLIVLAAMPFVTRLYSPHDFALLAVYLALVNILAAVACLRFDVAIPVAENDSDAAHLLVLALLCALALSGLGLLVMLAAPDRIAALLGQSDLARWLWLVPLGAFLAASYSALQFWATRSRRFGSIAVTRITQAVSGVTAMLALGWAGIAPLGLLLGNMLNIGAGGLRLGIETLRRDRFARLRPTAPELVATFGSYRRFPIYSTPEALANLAGIQVPILIVATFAGPEAGFLLLAQQVMSAPMALLGSSISQVYISRAPEALREGRLASLTLRILYRLLVVGVGPLALAGFFAPSIFPWVFGSQWARAGEIISWMMPWMILQFLASPISMVMHVVGRQKAMFVLTALGGALRIGTTALAIHIDQSLAVEVFSISGAIFYGICLLVFCRASGIDLKRTWPLFGAVTASLGIVAFGLFLGVNSVIL